MAPNRTAALGAALSITLGGTAAGFAATGQAALDPFAPQGDPAPHAIGDAIAAARLALVHDRLARTDARLVRRIATARGHRASAARLARLRRESVGGLLRDESVLRHRLRRANRASTASPVLRAIAACESGGNPRAIGGGGAFRGKYQFSYGTWASVGGTGDPAAASPAEQDRRAATLYGRTGPASWPVCGR
jgi:hypothetical protein